MNDILSEQDLAALDEDEAIERFLKATQVFLGPDPEIMTSHCLAPRSAVEEEVLARDWDRGRIGLIRNRLVTGCTEGWEMMSQIASSPGAKWGDAIAGIWTPSGDLSMVSSGGVLAFASITHYALRHIMKYYRDDPTVGIHEGDAFMHNDARYGAIHAPDFATFVPVLDKGELICWVGVSEHLGENGAIEPGGLTALAESVYGEGLRVPPIKIAEKGQMRRDLVTFLQNMVREPGLMLEDMNARLAVCRSLQQHVRRAIADHGREAFIAAMRLNLEDVEEEARRRIALLPDCTTRGVAFTDSTLREEAYIKIMCECRKEGDRLTLDFRGSSPEFANRTINSVLGSTKCIVGNLFSGFLWPDLPRNQGVISRVNVLTDEHSILSSSYETANSLSMLSIFPAFTAMQVALAKMMFTVSESRTKTIAPWFNMINTYVYGGVDQRGQIVGNISADVNGMPGGARCDMDGEHSISALFSVMGDLPETEVQEEEIPYIKLVSKRLLKDNQGFGKYRGGSGYFWMVSPNDTPLWGFAAVANGSRFPSIPGLFGGYGCGTYPVCKVKEIDIFDLVEDEPDALPDLRIDHVMNDRPFEDAQYVTQSMAMPFEFVQRGEIYMMSQGAGGGYGDVLERDPALVARDLRNEIISLETARRVYGVVANPETFAVDEAATSTLRDEMRAARLAGAQDYESFCADWVRPDPSHLPAPFFGCWDRSDEVFVGTDVAAPAEALQPVMLDDPRVLRIQALEEELAALRAAAEGEQENG